MSPTLHDALHLVNATDEESVANCKSPTDDLSPRDVADICDFVFGGDAEVLLPSFPDSRGKKTKRSIDDVVDPLECCDVRPRKKSMTMSRSYASLKLSSRVHLVRQESNSPDDDALSCICPNGLTANISDSFSSLSSIASDLRSIKTSEPSAGGSGGDGHRQSSSYGWFVQTEDESSVLKTVDAYAKIDSSSSGLAFAAPVAPIQRDENEEKELAWCAAADAVDDVLADFF